MTPKVEAPLRIFCSYARKDEEHLNDLRAWLRGLERQGFIEWWHDREIIPGWEWEEAIDKHLRTADVILLLVSTDFTASDYIYEHELEKAIERHERGEARVIPIIVRPVDWAWAPFSKLQAIPTDARPITKWPDRDEAWLDVLGGIRKSVEELLVERQERAAKERYRSELKKAWVDKKLSGSSAERLATLSSELSLGTDTITDIEREVMGYTKEAILERQQQAAKEERKRRLSALYAKARQSHRDEKWQVVVDVFERIHAEDPAYPDPEGLLRSARDALRAQKLARATDAARRYAEEVGVDLLEVKGTGVGGRIIERDLYKYRTVIAPSRVHKLQVQSMLRLDRTPRQHAQGQQEKRGFWRFLTALTTRAVSMTEVATSVTFSSDGKLLATGASDSTIRLWRVEDCECLHTLNEHGGAVRSVAFSPDGKLLASGGGIGFVSLYGIKETN